MATSSANDPQWVNPGWNCLSHTWCSPRRQVSHWPHAQTNGAVTRSPRPDLGDHAGEFVARDVWESDIRVVPHPPVPVTSAQTSGGHFNDNAGFRASGVIYGDYFGQLLESLVKHCTHCRSPRQ